MIPIPATVATEGGAVNRRTSYLKGGSIVMARAINQQFQAAHRYAKLIPKMKPANRRVGVLRLLAKIKAAINA